MRGALIALLVLTVTALRPAAAQDEPAAESARTSRAEVDAQLRGMGEEIIRCLRPPPRRLMQDGPPQRTVIRVVYPAGARAPNIGLYDEHRRIDLTCAERQLREGLQLTRPVEREMLLITTFFELTRPRLPNAVTLEELTQALDHARPWIERCPRRRDTRLRVTVTGAQDPEDGRHFKIRVTLWPTPADRALMICARRAVHRSTRHLNYRARHAPSVHLARVYQLARQPATRRDPDPQLTLEPRVHAALNKHRDEMNECVDGDWGKNWIDVDVTPRGRVSLANLRTSITGEHIAMRECIAAVVSRARVRFAPPTTTRFSHPVWLSRRAASGW